ncbi:MAG: ABC transporter permease [Flavobacteriales bacterium]|nr:ABC transporter permease [Flavobacteriales bacterium]MBK6945270.1 ABC transporter permease [Flavobacteriales bacterium]MBK7239621.1 ABC transporter permease [Flavobacteriales bacterium]MBK7298334.1 ABC transporter permease [Flavobacteriales bacterium]MBK9535173.1 ABC transporter permease [Flavobacteriales bacterium]
MHEHRIILEPGSADKHYWRDLWKFRGLFGFLAWRDILVRYKQTTIGVAWSVIRPVLTLSVMAFLGWLFESKLPGDVPRLLLVGAATLPWTFFSTAFSEAANSLVANRNLLTKIYFPRLIVPASTVIVCLIDFLISFIILVLLMIFYQFAPDVKLLLLPFFLLLALVTAMGTGILIAALNVKYRDFRYIIPFIVQFGLYVSPVAFSSADIYESIRIPEALKLLYAMNPMVGVIDGFRWCILGGETALYIPGFLLSIGVSFFFLFIGIRYFRRTERGFADVI